jgi:1,2-diacylglycerol 3-beta-galactosyltransferase
VRVLIAFSDTGGGHRALSQAVVGALRRHYEATVDVRMEDVFALPPPSVFDRVTRLYGPCIRLAPWLYGWLYHTCNHPQRYRALQATQRRIDRKLCQLLQDYAPDVIVNTHPLANRSLLAAVRATGRRTPVFAAVSELASVHTSWVAPGLRLLNTATTESYQAVLRWGAEPQQVRCVGLPVDERFAEVELAPGDLRAAMGLDPYRFTALLIGGGEGAGGIAAIVAAVQQTTLPIQLVVVCGRNERLRARLINSRLRTPTFVLGFVTSIPELMHAADVVITKGGPQTIAEALVAGRPVILSQTLPGQEEGNGRFVESRGVGFGPGPVSRIVGNLARLVENPDERAWMTANARRHGRPRAAAQVAEMIVQLGAAG